MEFLRDDKSKIELFLVNLEIGYIIVTVRFFIRIITKINLKWIYQLTTKKSTNGKRNLDRLNLLYSFELRVLHTHRQYLDHCLKCAIQKKSSRKNEYFKSLTMYVL